MRSIQRQPYRLYRTTYLHRMQGGSRRVGIYWHNVVDIASGLVRDLFPKMETAKPEKLSGPSGRRWCLYASYSPRSEITEMVFAQLHAYAKMGFSVVFITMSDQLSEADRLRLGEICAFVIHRRSFGRDFGAWACAAKTLKDELADAECILFANDSVLGPICPLDSWIGACLERPGFFGMTESLKGGCHLQSYFLIANGKAAATDALTFLRELKLTHSKWLMVQRGEIAFSRAMQQRGHYTAAILDHETIENALLDNPELLAELEILYPRLTEGLENASGLRRRYLLRSRLFRLPLNPNHQLNSVLLGHFRFPFIKVDLVTKNPGMVPSAPDWRYFITEESPVTEGMIDDHLASLI